MAESRRTINAMSLMEMARRIGALTAVAMLTCIAHACETPVYQHAMYEWGTDAWEVRYFHRAGEVPAADAEANERLRLAAPANVRFHPVEVSGDGSVAEEHAAAWRGHGVDRLPMHIVRAPGRGVVFTGRLDADEVERLLDSPRRRELANTLSSGSAGVLVVLADYGSEDVERVLRLARTTTDGASHDGRAVGLVEISRNDSQERWLVRQLLSIESDLAELSGSMVYGAFGRGRVVEPFVGEGVTAQGLRQLVDFMHGPCACELKASNPGLDLLMSWDWVDRLPQWAAGAATRPEYLLFDFGVDPEAEGSRPAEHGDR